MSLGWMANPLCGFGGGVFVYDTVLEVCVSVCVNVRLALSTHVGSFKIGASLLYCSARAIADYLHFSFLA